MMAKEKVSGYTQFRNGKATRVTKYARKAKPKAQKGLKRGKPYRVVPVRDNQGRFGRKIRYVKRYV